MRKFIAVHKRMVNLFFLLVITLMFALSCYVPLPVRYYKPLNEGKRIGYTQIIGGNDIILFEIKEGVIARTSVYFKDATDNTDVLKLILILSKEQTVRLASDKVEIHSPELSSPVIARVKSIEELDSNYTESETVYDVLIVKTKDGRFRVPPLGPNDELYGYKVKNPTFYRLSFDFINNNKDKEVTPENVTVFLPKIYINDELYEVEPLKFESIWSVMSIITIND